MLFARSYGIAAHYVPGISSMQAVGFEDIPLTHRVVSEGFWVLIGTKKDGTLSADLRLAMRSNSTVAIYMGLQKVAEIAATYVAEGWGHTPAAVVQHASLPQRKVAIGRVRDLPTLVAAQGITYPAIIFISDVVGVGRELGKVP